MNKKQISHLLTSALLLCLLSLLFFSCQDTLDVQEEYGFHLTHMPYYTTVEQGATVEVRCSLQEEAHFLGRTYTVRYFPYSGKGKLRIGRLGEPLLPNDRYPLFAGDFRLYYTPESKGAHDLELVVESNDGNAQTLSLQLSTTEITDHINE